MINAPSITNPLLDIVAAWGGRPAVAVIDLDALALNLKTIRSIIGPNVDLMAVVKANGYGHEALPIARTALESGASAIGVATVDEGVQLRVAGVEAPILVFGPIGKHERASAIGHRLSLTVSSPAFARALAADAKASMTREPVSVHLKIDTGMRRFGAMPEDVVDLAKAIAALEPLRLDGLMTHMAFSDADDPRFTRDQVAAFDWCVEELRAAGFEPPVQHVANSATTLRFPEYHKGMVRPGIILYGMAPDASIPLPGPLKPILTVHGRIARVFDLAPGDAVGYGRAYESAGGEQGALVSIGYADGYRRGLSSVSWMSIRGQRADVLGRVCMDQVMIRVPAGMVIEEGEPVVIVGDGTAWTEGAPTFDELGPLAGTLGYELVSGLARRLTRLYVRNGELVGVADLNGYRGLT